MKSQTTHGITQDELSNCGVGPLKDVPKMFTETNLADNFIL